MAGRFRTSEKIEAGGRGKEEDVWRGRMGVRKKSHLKFLIPEHQ